MKNCPGDSYKDTCCTYWCGFPNHGGGGYGGYGGCWCWCCCTCPINPLLCMNACGCMGGWGGMKYVDEKLTVLHFGSGGGGRERVKGGAGRGAMRLQCFGSIRLNDYA